MPLYRTLPLFCLVGGNPRGSSEYVYSCRITRAAEFDHRRDAVRSEEGVEESAGGYRTRGAEESTRELFLVVGAYLCVLLVLLGEILQFLRDFVHVTRKSSVYNGEHRITAVILR